MSHWWEIDPPRLDRELKELAERGFSYEVDEAAKAKGVLAVNLRVPNLKEPEQHLLLRAVFPGGYPFFPPVVMAPGLSLPRHQHPIDKRLCLLAPDAIWRPESDSLARLVQQQLETVLSVPTASADYVEGHEDHQGEPITIYLDYEPGSLIAVPYGALGAAGKGTLTLALDQIAPTRGSVLKILDGEGNVLHEMDRAVAQMHHGKKSTAASGRWVYLNVRPESNDPLKLLEMATQAEPSLGAPDWQRGKEGLEVDVVGLAFSDELKWRVPGTNWIFVVRYRIRVPQRRIKAVLVRTEHDARELHQARIPEIRPLQQKKIAVIGLGSLGSAVALELAKAGVGTLNLLDCDVLGLHNGVRWVLGRFPGGHHKVPVIQHFISEQYPYTATKGWVHRIGMPSIGPDLVKSDDDVVNEMLVGADLVIDATASRQVNHYLSTMAAAWKIPYVWLHATPGGWGGLVGRVVPGKTGCWLCHLYALTNGQVLPPPGLTGDNLQTVGCAEPTFTAANFDLGEVALMGVRMAVATLCAGHDSAYPDYGHDIAVLSMRSREALILPDWKGFPLNKDPQCCGA